MPLKKSGPSTTDVTIQALAQIFTALVENFGWAGALIVFAAWFIVHYATDDQKHRIIEQYILGKGIVEAWPLIIMSVTFVVTLFAQHRWYVKRLQTFTAEIEREGKAKSQLQGKRAGKTLPHAKTVTKPKGK